MAEQRHNMVMGTISVQLCLKVVSLLIVLELIYFLNSSEIPGEPSCKSMISLHVKITSNK